jgi:hypothetical protein
MHTKYSHLSDAELLAERRFYDGHEEVMVTELFNRLEQKVDAAPAKPRATGYVEEKFRYGNV